MNLTSISSTSYSTYLHCPYCWKLKYIDKLLIPDNENFIIGKALHTALENYHKAVSDDYTINYLKKIFLTEPIDNKKIDNFSVVKKMYELYKKYPLGGKTKSLEYEFRISLPRINATLHGFMDRVTKEGEIIDYKTTARDYTTEVANNVQAEIYSFALKDMGSKTAKVIFYIINKKKVKKAGYIPQVITLEPDTSKLIDKLVVFYNNVRDNKFAPIKGHNCNFCLFKEYCKHYKK